MTSLTLYLLLAALIFAAGLALAVTRRNAILVLAGVELMLNAANLNFLAFWRFGQHPEALIGFLFVMFSIAIAAAEAAIGLALILAVFRQSHTINIDQIEQLKG